MTTLELIKYMLFSIIKRSESIRYKTDKILWEAWKVRKWLACFEHDSGKLAQKRKDEDFRQQNIKMMYKEEGTKQQI